METQPIYIITGAPAAGKTTLAAALMQHYAHGLHIPVDELRLWVRGGLHEAIPWTDETERQFRLAEEAACTVAKLYQSAGYAVAIDHCRTLSRLNQMVEESLVGCIVRKILLLPDQETTLTRNANRTNKDFDPAALTETIVGLSAHYQSDDCTGWTVINTTLDTPEQTVASILG